MIRVTIYMEEHQVCRGFDLEGHAGFSESGTDIVCAAASMLVINTLGLESLEDNREYEPYIDIIFKEV